QGRIRARLCVSDVSRECALRRRISARHVDRAPADRHAPDRNREANRGGRGRARRDRQGNDQVRFELGYYALNPNVKVIAPWREWDLTSREKLLAYAEKHGIPVEMKRGKKSPYSMDANLLHISYEGGELEDPWLEPQPD